MDNGHTNASAERGLIGCLLNAHGYKPSMLLGLDRSDFTLPECADAFEAIHSALDAGETVDPVSVAVRLSSPGGGDEAQFLSFTMECSRETVGDYMLETYRKMIREASARRKAVQTVEDMLMRLRDTDEDIGPILEEMRQKSDDLAVSKGGWESLRTVAANSYEYLSKRARGEIKSITTGIPNVDRAIGGFFGGEMTIIGARPAVGKSAFGLNLAMQAAEQGAKVSICSREMTDVQLGQRMLSYTSRVDGMKLRRGELNEDDWGALSDALPDLSRLPIDFLFNVRAVEELRTEVQRKASKKQIDMLIVDYLQIMHTQKRFEKDYLRIGYISRMLKDMSVDFDIPVIALAQVGRATEGSMPTLSDLRGSGDIEQDADGVIFLHAPENDTDSSIDPRDTGAFASYIQNGLTYLCLGIAKQRQGVTGRACVLFNKSNMRYYQIERR